MLMCMHVHVSIFHKIYVNTTERGDTTAACKCTNLFQQQSMFSESRHPVLNEILVTGTDSHVDVAQGSHSIGEAVRDVVTRSKVKL